MLNAITGKPVWFRKLTDTTIAGEMRRQADEASAALWLLQTALETDDHDRAVRLMRDHWLGDDAKVRWIWVALSFRKKWTEAAVDLLVSVVRRTEISDPWHVADSISKVLPVAAIRLLAAWGKAAADRARSIYDTNARETGWGDLLAGC